MGTDNMIPAPDSFINGYSNIWYSLPASSKYLRVQTIHHKFYLLVLGDRNTLSSLLMTIQYSPCIVN